MTHRRFIPPPDRLRFTMTLRGEEVGVDVAVLPPDRSVGIMGYGFEDEVLTDRQGHVLPWDLTDDEVDQIIDKIQQYA